LPGVLYLALRQPGHPGRRPAQTEVGRPRGVQLRDGVVERLVEFDCHLPRFFLADAGRRRREPRGVTDKFPILPADANVYSPGDDMLWAAHGVRLGYFYSTLTAQNVNAFGGITDTPAAPPPLMRLGSNVILVPIQMVRVLPADATTTQF